MLNFERIFRHDCRISVTKILVSGFPSFMGKFATSGDGVHTSVYVSKLVGKILRHEWRKPMHLPIRPLVVEKRG